MLPKEIGQRAKQAEDPALNQKRKWDSAKRSREYRQRLRDDVSQADEEEEEYEAEEQQ